MKTEFPHRPQQPVSPLERQRFSAAQCEALFAAVLVHDDIYPHAELPETIHLGYSKEQLEQCYLICKQVWLDGVERAVLSNIIETIRVQHALDPQEQAQFKDIRAKFKHLRFAFATFDERHRYPRQFHWMIAVMGYLQDAFKNENRAAVIRAAWVLRLFLSKTPYAVMTSSLDRFIPSSTESFRRYVLDDIHHIRVQLASVEITSREFHDVRKVISRQVALYDNLKILYPSPYHDSISQYLSTINGMMGKMHDGLVVKKFDKTQDYNTDTMLMPDAIKQRLLALVSRYSEPVGLA